MLASQIEILSFFSGSITLKNDNLPILSELNDKVGYALLPLLLRTMILQLFLFMQLKTSHRHYNYVFQLVFNMTYWPKAVFLWNNVKLVFFYGQTLTACLFYIITLCFIKNIPIDLISVNLESFQSLKMFTTIATNFCKYGCQACSSRWHLGTF